MIIIIILLLSLCFKKTNKPVTQVDIRDYLTLVVCVMLTQSN